MAKKKKSAAPKRKAAPKKRAAKAVKAKKSVAKKKSGVKRKSGLTQNSYNLSEDLSAIVGSKKATRPEVVKQLWVYIKKNKLQDTKNRRLINPDSKLSKVIGSKPVDMLKLAGHISKHIKA